MLLRHLFQRFRYRMFSTAQLDSEISKKEKALQSIPSDTAAVYEAADIFDGLGDVAGGFEQQFKTQLDLFWDKQKNLRADLELLKRIRAKR